ncbi:MAG: plastocyanin/azurin family copper-binding protein [Dokdonella sp.]
MTLTPVLLASALALCAAPAFASDHVVHVGGATLTFTPSNIEALVGDTVTFVNDGGTHNVASDSGAPITFRCANGCDGAGGNGNLSGAAWTATINVTQAAAHSSIGYHCEAHQSFGMVGNISVSNPVDLQSFEID